MSGLTELPQTPQTSAAIAHAEQAPVTVTNAAGGAEPICFVRSWEGEAQSYANLVRHLSPEQPVYTIAPPRLPEYRDYPRDVAAWAAWCRERLRAVPHDGPLVLGGISFGGVIALDLAKLLIAEGRAVPLVVMLDTRVPRGHPHHERPHRSLPHRAVHHANALFEVGPGRRMTYLKEKAGWQVRHLRTWLASARARLAGLPPPDALPTPEELPLLQRCLWRAYLKYRPDVTSIPVAVYWTDESRGHTGDSTLGWGAWQRGWLEARRIDGRHLEVLHEHNAAGVAARLAHLLEHARRDPDRGA